MIDRCNQTLDGITHNAVDYSSGLVVTRVIGPEASQILATGTSIDLRPGKFPVGSCCRTRLGQVAAVIVAEAPEIYGIYIDRSFETYVADWLAESSSICLAYGQDALD